MWRRLICTWNRLRAKGLHPDLWTKRLVALLVLSLGLYAFFLFQHSGALSRWASRLPIQRSGTFHYMNLVSLIGFVLTGLGIWMTIRQLRHQEERIEDYHDFYHWIGEALSEIRQSHAAELYFCGPTILPGNLVCRFDIGLMKKIRAFGLALEHIGGNEDEQYEGKVEDVVIVAPAKALYGQAYQDYEMNKLAGYGEVTTEIWKGYVDHAKDEAVERHGHIIAKIVGAKTAGKVRREFAEVPAERLRDLRPMYVVSNGHRVVVGIPLHYMHKKDGKEIIPKLVGFSTTDSSVVRAFHQRIKDLASNGV